MPVKPIAGHGVELAFEIDPEGSPGTFTVFGSMTNAVTFSTSRESTPTTAHGDTVDDYLVSSVLTRAEIPIEANYLYGDTAHDAVVTAMLAGNTVRGWRITGPPGATAQVLIMSGAVTNLSIENPPKSGPRMLKFSFRPAGPMKMGTTVYS